MKKIIVSLLLLMIYAENASATGQELDKLMYKGKTYEIPFFPLETLKRFFLLVIDGVVVSLKKARKKSYSLMLV